MTSSYLSSMVSSLGIVVFGMFFVYFLLIFFLGLMFYYFTGNKPGERILANLARTFGRLYAQTWMFFTTFLGLIGLQYFLKAVMGSIFTDFVYVTSRYSTNETQIFDLKTGLIMLIFAVVVFVVHFGFNYLIENKEEKAGKVVMNKFFNGAGLIFASAIFFLSLLSSMTELVEFVSDSSGGTLPGATLATFMASFPIWLYYVVKTILMVRKEK